MKNTKIIYILISIFCVFAVIAGIYAQFIEKDNGSTSKAEENNASSNTNSSIVDEANSQTEIKANFNNLFTNTINLGGYDTTGIQKLQKDEEIVYSTGDIKNSTDKYEIDMNIPLINIDNDFAKTLNNTTQTVFVNKANEIIADTESTVKTIYSIDFVAYVNDDILSLVIKSTLKEGSSAQRIMIQTYNFNLTTNTEVTLTDLATVKMLNRDEVNNRIKEVATEANEEAQALQAMGYSETYVRDLTSDIYSIDGANVYFLGPNKELYIVYPYGNNEFTSAMDIVLFE